MKAPVICILLCVLALAFARESQVSILEELLDHVTLGQNSRKTAFKRLSGKPILDALSKMRVQLDKEKEKALDQFEKSEKKRLRTKETAEKELAEAKSSLEEVKRANEMSKKEDEKAHRIGMELLRDDRSVIKKMMQNLELLKKYKIPSGRIEAELAKIRSALLKKESELRETLKKQNEARKRLRTVAENALKREKEELEATLADNKRTKANDKKKLDDDLASIKEEHDLINKIEKIITGQDLDRDENEDEKEKERKEAERKEKEAKRKEDERKAREAAKKAKEAAERRRIEKEKREAEAERKKAEAEKRRREKRRANCKEALEAWKKQSYPGAKSEWKKSWTRFLDGVVMKNKCDKRLFRKENEKKKKEYAAKVKLEKENNCDEALKKFKKMDYGQSKSEWKKSSKTFMDGVVAKNECDKSDFEKLMKQKKKDHEAHVKIQKIKNCEKALDTFKRMSYTQARKEWTKSWKTFLGGAVVKHHCDKSKWSKEYQAKIRKHNESSQRERKKKCDRVLNIYKRMTPDQAVREWAQSWSTFLGGAVVKNKCNTQRWSKVYQEKVRERNNDAQRKRTCDSVLNTYKRMTPDQAVKEYRKPWSTFLGGAVIRNKCKAQRWSKVYQEKVRERNNDAQRKRTCDSILNTYKRMSPAQAINEWRKSWSTFLGGAVIRNKCNTGRWSKVYQEKVRERNNGAQRKRTCESILNAYKRMSPAQAVKEYRKPWSTFLGGAVIRNKCKAQRWYNVYKEKARSLNNASSNSRICNNLFEAFKRMSLAHAKKEYRKPWSTFMGGAVVRNKCKTARWSTLYHNRVRNGR